jgi:hypothetical protein
LTVTVNGRWVSFQLEDRRAGAKTDVWNVWSLKTPPFHLGRVKWFSSWRKYAFFPTSQTLYEQDCLRDIAGFIEAETLNHKKGRRAFQ